MSNIAHMNEKNKPVTGQKITVRGIVCEIVKVYPFGTVDVVALDNSAAFRVTGLNFI